jgi:tetratricopeptide (TPR) repeat protein
MTASETDLMTTCPVEVEELAAFIDGRLTSERRARVLEHLDTCADCRDIVMTADEVAIAEASAAPNVVHGRFWKRALPAAAAAAMATWLFLGPFSDGGMKKVVAASETFAERPIAARFSANFPHKPHRPKRGPSHATEPSDVTFTPPAIYEVVDVDEGASAKKLHAAGVAWMYSDEEDKVRYAIQALEQAAAKKPDDAAILTDLSAARYAAGEYELALKAADRVLAIEETPAALWNRAVALEGLRRDNEATATWNRYLQLDSNSEWAEDARGRLKLLQ